MTSTIRPIFSLAQLNPSRPRMPSTSWSLRMVTEGGEGETSGDGAGWFTGGSVCAGAWTFSAKTTPVAPLSERAAAAIAVTISFLPRIFAPAGQRELTELSRAAPAGSTKSDFTKFLAVCWHRPIVTHSRPLRAYVVTRIGNGEDDHRGPNGEQV